MKNSKLVGDFYTTLLIVDKINRQNVNTDIKDLNTTNKMDIIYKYRHNYTNRYKVTSYTLNLYVYTCMYTISNNFGIYVHFKWHLFFESVQVLGDKANFKNFKGTKGYRVWSLTSEELN